MYGGCMSGYLIWGGAGVLVHSTYLKRKIFSYWMCLIKRLFIPLSSLALMHRMRTMNSAIAHFSGIVLLSS